MIEGGGIPCGRIMANCTIMIKIIADVIRIGDPIEIRLMTAPAIGRSILITIGMASTTNEINMCTGQWELRLIMIKV